MSDWVLAVDLGSSWCKAALLDREGHPAATGRAPTRHLQPARHHMLEAFWQAFAAAVRDAVTGVTQAGGAMPRPAAIGISCRGMFGVTVDADGQASWPAWDYESSKSSPEVQAAYAADVWGEQDPFAYGYATRLAALLLWLRQERPDEWRQIHYAGALHDYIVYRLTGSWVTDPTTGPGNNDWPQAIAAISGLPLHVFPRCLDFHALAGALCDEAAQELGLPAGVPVVTGMHDGAAANLGLRAIQPGDACLTLGTNFVLRTVTGPRLTSRSFAYVVAPGAWAWVNNVPLAAPQLDLVAETLCADLPDMGARHRELGRLAGEIEPGAHGLVLERITRPSQAVDLRRRVIQALAAGYSAGSIYRALLESIALGVRDLIRRAREDGACPQRFIATGGAAQNHAFLKVLAAVLDTPIEVGYAEAGVVGAGIAAAVGAGWFPTLHDGMIAMTAPTVQRPLVVPDAAATAYYRADQTARVER